MMRGLKDMKAAQAVRVLIFATATVSATALAQQPGGETLAEEELAEIRKNVDIFSNVLEDALGLDERSGLFDTRAGDARGRYLANQGVVIELRTPLGSRRGGPGMRTINSSLQDLSGRLSNMSSEFSRRGPQSFVRRPDIDEVSDRVAQAFSRESLSGYYEDVMESLNSVDFPAVVEGSLQSARNAASSLYRIGQLEEEDFERLNQELGGIREEMREKLNELQEFRDEIRNRAMNNEQEDEPVDDSVRAEWEAKLQNLVTDAESLKESAQARASELIEQYAQARAASENEWRSEVAAFEDELIEAVCNYSATLRSLPESEYLTIVLPGLGEEDDDGERSSRVHVFAGDDLIACQSRQIEAAALMSRAQSYSY